MNRRQAIINRLSEVVRILGDLSDEFVFVGGSVVPLLVTDEGAPDARLTVDVDAIVEVLRLIDYYKIQERLAKVGFRQEMMEAVICRFKSGELTLDVMPTVEEVLKFGNRWYSQAMRQPISYPLLPERAIKIINAPLFLCTKFDAYHSRGTSDQKDLEDIIAVIDGRRELLEELRQGSMEVRQYVSESATALLDSGLFVRLSWFLPGDAAGTARGTIVRERLTRITELLL